MTEMCQSCANARAGGPIPYDDLDPEMVGLVEALNTIPGLRTIDSCFGHPGSGRTGNHQSEAFVGMLPTDHDASRFNAFWENFFSEYGGKIVTSRGYIQFTVVIIPTSLTLSADYMWLPNMIRYRSSWSTGEVKWARHAHQLHPSLYRHTQ